MVVSVPEKTLEHWASIYLTYRYRSHAALWWPTLGEDVHAGYLSPRPGKSVQLELKTTTLSASGNVHTVKIDLQQLENYLKRPHHLRPFYVFPRPRWTNKLEAAVVAAGGPPVAELGFRRSNSHGPKQWWFASWMVAMTTDDVAAALSAERAKYLKGGPSTAVLVRDSFKTGRRKTKWVGGGAPASTIPWQMLWNVMDECGRPAWPQTIRVPATFVRRDSPIQHAEVRGMLAESRYVEEEDLVTLGSTGEGTFTHVDESDDMRDDVFDRDGREHRIAVFLDTAALQLD